MDMIGHYNKIVYFEFARAHIGTKNVDKEIGHALRLQDCFALAGSGADKECARGIACGVGTGIS